MRRAITSALLIASLAAPTAAFADSPSQGGYNSTSIVVPPGGSCSDTGSSQGGMTQSGSTGNAGNCGSVEGASATSPASAVKGASATSPAVAAAPAPVAQVTPTRAASSGGGTLPFTGLDLGLVAALAVGLLGLGFALRRSTAAPQDI
ncbi:MAG: hypothetical protein JWM71_2088 [Solirubrobacteraceae bacterium]|nr:hypothetical protein [Solirubrobacteraceae bacterium]